MTDSDLKRFNKALAQDLGRAPNGAPLYMWMRPRDLFYYVEDAVDVLTPFATHERIENYRKITWEDRLGVEFQWMVATWQDPGSELQWESRYKRLIPYPPNGMYFPLDGSQIPCDPTMEITEEVVAKVKRQLNVSYEEHLANLIEQADRDDAAMKAESDDMIDSDWPCFDGEVMVPGHTPEKEEISCEL